MGGMRTARRAGPTEAMTVTPMPTARETIAGCGPRTRVGRMGGRCRRRSGVLAAGWRPRTPKPIPITNEMAPTMAASVSTERKTWRRLAPTTRNKASSRVRWPTVIENVLKMVNAPTKREMKANAGNPVEKNESAWLTALLSSCLYHGLTGHDLGSRPAEAQGDATLDGGLVGARLGHDVDVGELTPVPPRRPERSAR